MLSAILYVLLLGATPSAVRGGIMGSLAIIGILSGREYRGLLGLHVAAMLMTLYQPHLLWDIGFELSFLGTLGLFIIARPLEDKMRGWPPLVREGVALTIAAELTTLPLTMFYFHQLSPIAIFANLFGVPALELVLATGGLTVLGGWLWSPLGIGLGWVAAIFASYLLGTVHFFAQLPFGHAILPQFHPVWIGLYYIVLAAWLGWWRDDQKRLEEWLLQLAQSRRVQTGLLSTLMLVWSAIGFSWFTHY
jgi:competence protein ComEC